MGSAHCAALTIAFCTVGPTALETLSRERFVAVTRLVACARGLRRSRSEEKSRSLLNRALRALNKDPHLVTEAATALSLSGRGLIRARVKSLSIRRWVHSGCVAAEQPAIRVTLSRTSESCQGE